MANPTPNPVSTAQAAQALRQLAQALEAAENQPQAQTLAGEVAALCQSWGHRLAGHGAASGNGASLAAAPGKTAPQPANGAIQVWCDGSCSPNPGPGGWGTIVEAGGQRRELMGSAGEATNNIMEMTAAIEGLKATPPGAQVAVTTDSRYLVDGITKWVRGWKRKNWVKSDGEPVLNRPLWEALDQLAAERKVTWHWVRGHQGHPENERCDALANQARKALTG